VPKIKGSHTAMKSGMLAGEQVFAALAEQSEETVALGSEMARFRNFFVLFLGSVKDVFGLVSFLTCMGGGRTRRFLSFSFSLSLSLPLYAEGTSLTTSLRYQDSELTFLRLNF
jgi:hypothetical protein